MYLVNYFMNTVWRAFNSYAPSVSSFSTYVFIHCLSSVMMYYSGCMCMQVYGSTALRARVLRSFEGGKMKITGSGFLPFNGDTEDGVGIALENAPNAETRFPVGGDIRVSENTALLVLQTLFLREHNKVEKETSGTSGQTWLVNVMLSSSSDSFSATGYSNCDFTRVTIA